MKIDLTIFGAYDLRGLYPAQINQKVAFWLGQAFVKFLKKPKLKIVIARDNRPSSFLLFKALSEGITSQGAKVTDMGLATTPMLYWATFNYNFDGGIMITASHLSKEFNGFKLVKEKALPISQKTGLEEIKKFILNLAKIQPKNKIKKGKILRKNFLKNYIESNLKKFNIQNFKNLKIVIDPANSVPSLLIKELKKKLPLKIYSIFDNLDSNFPNHLPDPLIKDNLKALQKEVIKRKAHLGVAFDGDGDRIIFVDEKGKIARADFITALLSQKILKENPGQKILYDVRSSQIVKETIEQNKGLPILSQAGHSLIKEKMQKEDIIFGGELSGHYYFKEVGFFEAPLLVLLLILEILTKENKPLSKILSPFKKYFQSGEINFKVKDKIKKIKEIENYFKNAKEIINLDGLTVREKNWWFNLRPSKTENLLRLNVEAKTKKLLKKNTKKLISLIKSS